MANQMVKDLTFAEFMQRVNAKLESLIGMTADDMADFCYLDFWRAGDSVNTTAKAAIKYARDCF